MPSKKVESVLKSELKIEKLEDLFDKIYLDKPLGSASIAQVIKCIQAKINSIIHNIIKRYIKQN